jgi:hypothetical protein
MNSHFSENSKSQFSLRTLKYVWALVGFNFKNNWWIDIYWTTSRSIMEFGNIIHRQKLKIIYKLK